MHNLRTTAFFLPRRVLRVRRQQRGHSGALYEEDEQHVLAIPRLPRHLRQRVCHVQHPGVCQKILLGDRVAQGKGCAGGVRFDISAIGCRAPS